jgi:hypothetical protein
METNLILIILSGLVLVSFVFDRLARQTRIPSVLMLIGLGLGLQLLVREEGWAVPNVSRLLPVLGTVGLILIVLEGALDLHLGEGKNRLIGRALASAFVVLLVTSLGMTFVIQHFTQTTFYQSLVNAVPLGVVSSAVAIPSVMHLGGEKREFLIYETSLSDILGVVLLNFVLTNPILRVGSFVQFGLELLVIGALSLGSCLLLLLAMQRNGRFFLILSALLLVYAVGKLFHLSSLLLVLVFGLFINNTGVLIPKRLTPLLNDDGLEAKLPLFKTITAEGAFFVRTLFFTVFGYTVNLNALADGETWLLGSVLVALIFVVRGLYLKFGAKVELIPELFVAPRGLITILLFLSIPAKLQLVQLEGVLLLTVLLTSLVMTLGLQLNRRSARLTPEEAERT